MTELARDARKLWRRIVPRSGAHAPLPTAGPLLPQASLLQKAGEFFRSERSQDSRALAAGKVSDVAYFDVEGMQSVVAVCNCGRSGSLLLSSHLDGHDNVIMLPLLLSALIYPFLERYPSLSLREKLLTYPFCSAEQVRFFFQGDHRVEPAHYYAAVNALLQVYESRASRTYLQSRRAFFQLLHVVYCVALGRRPASPRPLMVYAQHGVHDELAHRLLEDFPEAQFVHTVRDPIANCDSLFDFYAKFRGFLAPVYVVANLTSADMPHTGLEGRSRAIRFEDLHSRPEETMNSVAGWLGLACRPSLLASTFNEVPYVVRRGATAWSGARPQQAQRTCRNISRLDCWLLFAILYEDFAAWSYGRPRAFRMKTVRVLTCLLVLLLPTKMELLTVRNVCKLILSGRVRFGLKGVAQIVVGRLAIMALLAVELHRRLVLGKPVLKLG